MPDSAALWRLFLAVPLDEPTRRALTQALSGVQLPGRPVLPLNWHITLRFLGDVDVQARHTLQTTLSATTFGPPFALRLSGIAAFPTPARPRVIVAKVEEQIDAANSRAVADVTAAADAAAYADAAAVAAADSAHSGRQLAAIAEELEAAARSVGLPPERRPFTPHVTVARLRQSEDVREWLTRKAARVALDIPLVVRELVLFRSHLGAGPARYEAIAVYALPPSTA